MDSDHLEQPQMSTNPTSRPVYELRIYRIKPEFYKDFQALITKHWSIRTAHSKSVGVFTTDIGGVAEVVQIWEYESLNQRAAARKILAEDEKWAKNFLPTFFPQAIKMNNALMILAPGSTLHTDFQPSASAVYELHTYESGDATPAVDASETLVGRFRGVYGPTGTEYLLVRYPDADVALAAAIRRREETNVKGYSRFMTPNAWSPLK